MVKVEGHIVQLGDWISFKSDIEQVGKVIEIWKDGTLVLEASHEFHGDYIGGQKYTNVNASDCWID